MVKRLLIAIVVVLWSGICHAAPPLFPNGRFSTSRPAELPFFPFLSDEDAAASVSVGTTSNGYLVNGVPLLEGHTLRILPEHRKRQLHHGTRELVGALNHAADALYDATGTQLWIGNLSYAGGGNIEYSVSHNSGRDVDVAYCYRDQAGARVDPIDYVRVYGTTSQDGELRIDIERMWIVTKALLTNPHARVQFMFVSPDIEQQILEHAQRLREPLLLRVKAEETLRQAHAPHNDHMHVRLYCTARDVAGGCQNTGAVHPWIDLFEGARAERINYAKQRLSSSNAEHRRRALLRLLLLEPQKHRRALRSALHDRAPLVRRSAALAIGALGDEALAAWLHGSYATEHAVSVKLALIDGIADLGGHEGSVFIRDVISNTKHAALRLAAISASERLLRLEPVPALVQTLESEDPKLRQRAARSLRMITAHDVGVDWVAGEASKRQRGVTRWRLWADHYRGWRRSKWLTAAFKRAGHPIRHLVRQSGWELTRALDGPPHRALNAQRQLQRLFKHETPRRVTNKCEHWRGWLASNRRYFEDLPVVPRRVCR